MGATSLYGFTTVETGNSYSFHNLINGVTQSIEDKLPQRYVASIAALDAMSSTTLYPSGMTAVITAASSGLAAGAIFVRAGSQWRFTSGTVTALTTFVAALSSNVGTVPGATFYDQGNAVSRIFTNTSGNSEILIGGSTWTNVSYASGYEQWGLEAPFGYRLVPGGVMLRGTIRRSNGKAIATGAQIATLPAVARPSYASRAIVGGVAAGVGQFTIGTNGAIVLYAAVNRTSHYYVFDGVFLPQT